MLSNFTVTPATYHWLSFPFLKAILWTVLVAGGISTAFGTEKSEKVLSIGLNRQLFIDDFMSPHHPGTRRGLGIAFSPDGLHWTRVRDFATDEIIDISHIFMDPNENNQFVIYGRTLRILPEIRKAWEKYDWFEKHYNGRAVIRSESTDFLHWEPAEFILGPDLKDPVSTMIYSMNVFPYEGIYLKELSAVFVLYSVTWTSETETGQGS